MAVAHEASGAVLAPAASAAAERLFHEHSGWVYGYCLRLLRSPEDAEDALQATYLNACRSLNQGTRPLADSAWLLRIAQNVCLTRLRSSGRRARLERVHDVTLLEETVAAPDRPADDLIGLTGALASLPEQQRKAILLREWQGLSYSEVAHRLGLTQAAVETLIFRGRRSLAAALENPGKRVRVRSLHALDVGGLLAAVKGLLGGSAGVKAVAALAVAAATTTVVATDPAGVWRDRPELPTAPAGEQMLPPDPGSRAVVAVPAFVRVYPDESRPGAGLTDPASPASEHGRAFGQATAAEAKAKPKTNNGNGKALGHAKQAASEPRSSNGRGTPGAGRPDTAGETGPPPQAQATDAARA